MLPSILDWNAILTKKWKGDGVPTDVKRKKQAEFLVKEDIAPETIVGFVCYNDFAKLKLLELNVLEQMIKVVPKAYY